MKDPVFGLVDAVHFDRRGYGPFDEQVEVRANVDPSPHYPMARIYVGSRFPEAAGESRDCGAFCFTIAEARQLAGAISAAADAAAKACPAHVLASVPEPP